MLKKTTAEAYVYPLFFALVCPIVIGLFNPSLIWWLLGILLLLLPTMMLFRVFQEWQLNNTPFLFAVLKFIRPVPAGIVYNTDLRLAGLPWATLLLIFVNASLYYLLPTEIVDQYVFTPAGEQDPGTGRIVLSAFTSAFLHANAVHLWSNMIFLWVFGSVLEARLKAARFLLLYLFSILASNLLVVCLLFAQAGFTDLMPALRQFHSLGASGAVAGIMGAFVVRCFFARISVTLPLLFLPFVSVPFKVQGTVLIAIFFAMDIAGSVSQFRGEGEIDYWAHVGGYLGAMLLAYCVGLQNEAAREAVHVRAQRYGESYTTREEAIGAYNRILESEGEDEKALEFFLHQYRFNPQKQGEYFARLIEVLAARDYAKAKELFNEYYPRFANQVSGRRLLQFGTDFSRNQDLARAKLCLELASQKEGPWKEKALLELAGVYSRMQLDERARELYEEIAAGDPENEFSRVAKQRLGLAANSP